MILGRRVVENTNVRKSSKESKEGKVKFLEVCRRRRKFARRWTSSAEEHLVIRRNCQAKTDGWYSQRRIHNIS
jgi:hypothetical protein